jgi:hypothetical protein
MASSSFATRFSLARQQSRQRIQFSTSMSISVAMLDSEDIHCDIKSAKEVR